MIPSVARPRYGLTPFFLIAVFFVITAPTFWHLVELQQAQLQDIYENRELYDETYPRMTYMASRLGAAELPLWNETQNCGEPAAANPAFGTFQPLNIVFLVLPAERAMAVHAFICLTLMGIGFVGFARAVSANYTPALAGAIVYAYCGASAGAMSRPGMAAAPAWAPFIFWALREFAATQRMRFAVLAGLTGALLLLSGAAALALVLLLTAVAYAGWCVALVRAEGPYNPLGIVAGLALTVVVMLLVSAVQWIPAAAAFAHGGYVWPELWNADVAAQIPATVEATLAQLLSANPGALPRIGYAGVLPLLVFPAAVFHQHAQRDAWFALLSIIGLIAIARALPPEAAGFPVWVVVYPAVLGLGLLTALGADRLLQPRAYAHVERVWLPALFAAIALVVVFTLAGGQVRGYIIALTVIGLPALVFRKRWLIAPAGLLLVLLLFADLTVASVNAYRHPFQDMTARQESLEPLVNAMRDHEEDGRILVVENNHNAEPRRNIGMTTGLRVINGAPATMPPSHRSWFEYARRAATDPEAGAALSLLRYAGLQAVLWGTDPARADTEAWDAAFPERTEHVTDTGARYWTMTPDIGQAAWFADWTTVESEQAMLEFQLAQPVDAPLQPCVAHSPDAPEPAGAEEAETPAVEVTAQRPAPEEAIINVEADRLGLLVFTERADPGWRATVNGEAVPIVSANGVFQGVFLEAGEHEVRFIYRPASFRLGYTLSMAGLAICVLAGWIGVARPTH